MEKRWVRSDGRRKFGHTEERKSEVRLMDWIISLSPNLYVEVLTLSISDCDCIFGGKFIKEVSSVQSFGCVRLFMTPWTAAHQASLSNTNSQRLLKLKSIESVMPFSHLHPVDPFSSCLQSFPASGSFPVSQFSHQVTKVLEVQLQHWSFQWIFRTDFLEDWLVGSPSSLRVFSNL